MQLSEIALVVARMFTWFCIGSGIYLISYIIHRAYRENHPPKKIKDILGRGWGFDNNIAVFECSKCCTLFFGYDVKIKITNIDKKKIQYINCPNCKTEFNAKELRTIKLM